MNTDFRGTESLPLRSISSRLQLGHLIILLLLGLTLYARHVILHAQGLLPARETRPAKQIGRKSAKGAANSAVAKIDSAHDSTPRRSDLTPSSSQGGTPHSHLSSDSDSSDSDYDESSDYDDEDNVRGRKLTKAERKRLRKQKAEERGW